MRIERSYILIRLLAIIGILLSAGMLGNYAYGQQQPPRPFSIHTTPAQGLFFGAFYHGNAGGTVIIFPDGSRSTTGDVIQASLGFQFSPAIIEVEADAGTRINIMNGGNATLTGSNGGFMTMQVGTSDPAVPFIITTPPPARTQVRIGAILNVGNSLANPVGAYSGQFNVTFVQE
jgi:hypothetical protein